ncbi:MAG: sugar ABC transporter ATP-binding protein [Gluconacetobacter diazotrophicus]|nr:sugar ABC transporter ATP-binding protein [Gluconacetobacter diazotrophicus]
MARDTDGGIAARTRGVGKVYGTTTVLSDVSITIPAGDARGLVGRNGAGKSTLVSILTGLNAPSTGTVELGGRPAPPLRDRAAWRERVACVYQRWTVIPSLSVAENLFLNDQPRGAGGIIGWRRMRERAREVLLDWNVDVDPEMEAARLNVDQRQIVEIGRALLQGSRFIILDEPTAELERSEIHRLFDRIRGLQESGVTFVYISHHLEELYEICRSVTVLRDGGVVADAALADLPQEALVRAMVGEQGGTGIAVPRRRGASRSDDGGGLSVRGLRLGEAVRDVSFAVAAGECVGLAGGAASGKEEVGEILAGLLVPEAGSVTVAGTVLPFGRPLAARDRGVGYVPRDRHHRGILPLLSLAENLTVTVADRLGRFGFISPGRQQARADALMGELSIVASSREQPIGELSGGNQQKGIMGRALASGPKLLVLAGPTQGVDIASKDTLFAAVAKARAAGTAVLVLSDELDELSICDRLVVMHRGAVTREFGAERDDHEVVAAIEGLSLGGTDASGMGASAPPASAEHAS